MDENNSIRMLTTEILVIGGGGAGLAAALTAAEKGVRVILVEKLGTLGGNTVMSSGHFAVESPAQRRQAIDARSEEFFKIAMDFAHWKTEPRLVRNFIDRSSETIKWLESKDLIFDCFPMYPNQIPTWHHARPKKYGGRGAEVVKTLHEEAIQLGVQIFTRTQAKKILSDNGNNVYRVFVERYGKEIEIHAKSVVIATGGFAGNKDLLNKYAPLYRENMVCDGLPHTGDGLLLAQEVGADTEGLGLLLLSGPQIPNAIAMAMGVPPDTFIVPLMAVVLEPNTLWVNKEGKRFADETIGYNHYVSSNAVNRQPENLCYVILDRDLVKTMEDEGFIMGLGATRIQQRTKMNGLERELKKQAEQGVAFVAKIDKDLCSGCGTCVFACPRDAVTLETTGEHSGEYSPCGAACPLRIDTRAYMHAVKMGEIKKAYHILKDFLPFPSITGRVCPRLCESDCSRNEIDDPVNVGGVERFLGDLFLGKEMSNVETIHPERIAIVGSGPAGLACAYFLKKMGYHVSIFEAMSYAGGMLRFGIPEYRLPKYILDKTLNDLKKMGIEFRTGQKIGKDIPLENLREEYKALFLAIGCQLSRRLKIPGIELEGVMWGLDFLRTANSNLKIQLGTEIVVVGGGNVAVDVALTALRLGAKKVELVCLEKGNEIPAFKEELNQLVEEGVKIYEGWGPLKVVAAGEKIKEIHLQKCLKVFDEKGKFNPTFDPRTTKALKAHNVIFAIGQSTDLSTIPENLHVDEEGKIPVDPVTLETNLEGVFAGGDVVSARGSVVQAIADGKTAALSIDLYIKGKNLREGRAIPIDVTKNIPKEGILKTIRKNEPVLPVEKRMEGFPEVKRGFDEYSAREEAERCMTCGGKADVSIDLCQLCRFCIINCPAKAISPAPLKKINPIVKMANTLEEIAEWIGADPTVLKATVEEYNKACDNGYDHLFGKDRKYLMPIQNPPFFAIQANSDFLDTIGGIKVNEHMMALNTGGDPIPGLFAAGVIVGGWQGDTYCVILSGAASGFALTSGRIAAESAIEYLLNY
jgi:NADPH-dependent glutamate synthase beta subunit-like oxidoreductase